MPLMFSPSTMFLIFFFAHENMKKPASKVAKPAQIQPKSQFLFHKNLPPRDFSIMTLIGTESQFVCFPRSLTKPALHRFASLPWEWYSFISECFKIQNQFTRNSNTVELQTNCTILILFFVKDQSTNSMKISKNCRKGIVL